MKENDLIIEYGDHMIVTPDLTKATLTSRFTDNTEEIAQAKRKFKAQWQPTSLSYKVEQVLYEVEGLQVEFQILVWDAEWDHSKPGIRPSMNMNHVVYVNSYGVGDFGEVVIDEDSKFIQFWSRRN